jgi:hypothetical protein
MRTCRRGYRRPKTLPGLGDRLAALDGRFPVETPVDGGALIAAVIPLTESRA